MGDLRSATSELERTNVVRDAIDEGSAPGIAGHREIDFAPRHAIIIRPLSATDRPALATLAAEPSTSSLIDHWFQAHEHGGGRLVVVDDEELVAHAGYDRMDSGDAELDIAIDPEDRGWLGPVLLDAVVEHARERGVRNLVAQVDRSNGLLLALLHERGCVTTGYGDGSVVHLAIGVRATVPVWPDDDPSGPRIVLEGRGLPWAAAEWARTHGAQLVACHIATMPGPSRCPGLCGQRCPLAADADLVIVTLGEGEVRAHDLLDVHVRHHRRPQIAVRGWPSPPPGVPEIPAVDPPSVERLLDQIGPTHRLEP